MTDPLAALSAVDPQIADVIQREVDRQNTTIQLIASENFTSPAVLAAQGSVLTNKYSEGYPGKRYYGGNLVVDEAEDLARQRVRELFGADHANVQPHSGANANMAAYLALLEPGDKVMGMRLDQGGHLTHGSPVNFSGRIYEFVAYGVDDETECLDYDAIRAVAVAERPKLIVAGATAYPRTIDFAAFRSIADEVGALLMVDAAHIAGLIAGGAHPSPVPHADVVTFTTHKTLRGPRAGTILCREQFAAAIDKAVFPGLQGGPLMHVIAAKAVAFREAAQPEFRDVRGPDRRQRAGARRRAGRRGLPHRVGRHRQPPDARRPPALRGHRQGRPGGPRRRRHHHQQERDPQRPREAVRHPRAAARHRGGHHRGHGRGPRWSRSRPSSPGCCALPTTSRCATRSARRALACAASSLPIRTWPPDPRDPMPGPDPWSAT